MDLIWVCRGGQNEELRYSIRSATCNLDHTNVWLVGNKPDWYVGPFIQSQQVEGKKYDNVKAGLLKAIKSNQVSDDLVLMYDDFYVLQTTELDYYYSGTLDERI